jgi:hypothetical protein
MAVLLPMIFSIEDEPTEAIIQRKVEIIQSFIKPHSGFDGTGINPAMKKVL